ncbi:DUF3963 domain-containing protein [Bacillus cereus]
MLTINAIFIERYFGDIQK